jgi:hypothetical protein
MIGVFLTVVVAASWSPARRAAQLDPVVACGTSEQSISTCSRCAPRHRSPCALRCERNQPGRLSQPTVDTDSLQYRPAPDRIRRPTRTTHTDTTDTDDLVPTTGVTSIHSSVAISRHTPRSVSDLRGLASRSSLQEHEHEAPDHRDGGRRSQPARDSLRRHEATRGNRHRATTADHCSASSGSTAPDHAHRWAGDSHVLRAPANGVLATRDVAAVPGGSRHPAGTSPGHRN